MFVQRIYAMFELSENAMYTNNSIHVDNKTEGGSGSGMTCHVNVNATIVIE